MLEMSIILRNLLISLLFGLAVFLITTVTVWRSTGDYYHNNHAVKHKTLHDIRSLRTAIETYRLEHGIPPPTLDIVANEIDQTIGFWRNEMEAKPGDLLVDSYGTPYRYRTTGTSYTLISLGQDRKPGGMGYNADIVYDEDYIESEGADRYRFDEIPPYREYWSFKHTSRPLKFCIGTGIVSFLLAFYSLQKNRNSAAGREYATWKTYAAILVGAIVITSFLAWFHVPSTH